MWNGKYGEVGTCGCTEVRAFQAESVLYTYFCRLQQLLGTPWSTICFVSYEQDGVACYGIKNHGSVSNLLLHLL